MELDRHQDLKDRTMDKVVVKAEQVVKGPGRKQAVRKEAVR